MLKSNHSCLKPFTKQYEGLGVVYAFSDNENIVYIGSTKNLYVRLVSHDSLLDKNSLRAKSKESIYKFNISVICTTENLSMLTRLEQHAIDTYTLISGSKPLYNISNCYTDKQPYKYKDYL